MIAFNLEGCPQHASQNMYEAWSFLEKLLTAHINQESPTSLISSDKSNDLVIGQIQSADKTLHTVCTLPDIETSYPAVIVWLLKSSGYLPDSTSINRYSPNQRMVFYTKAQNYLAEFECIASMPEHPRPQVMFKLNFVKALPGFE